jgi:hypothetical protein
VIDKAIIMAGLQAAADELAREVARLPEAATLWKPNANEWCQHEVLTHIWGGDRYVYLLQLRAIAAANPPLPAEIDAEAQQRPGWDPSRPRADLLAACLADRQSALALLATTDWERRYADWPITLGWVAQSMLGHSWEHTSQMLRVRLQYELHGPGAA